MDKASKTMGSFFSKRVFLGMPALFWLSVLILIVTVVVYPSQFAHAAGETYTYADSGNKISGKGGKLGNSTVVFTKSPLQAANGAYKYTGSAVINDNSGKKCTIGLEISAQKGASSGTISAPAYSNGLPSAGYGGQNVTPSCDKNFAASVSDLNTGISIKGSTSNPTNPVEAETSGEREIIPTVWSTKPISQLPTTSATLTKVTSSTAPKSQVITWNSSSSSGETHFTNIDPGSYIICIKPTSDFTFNPCQTVTKVKYQPLVVTFGSADTAYNKDGKLVNITVKIAVPTHIGKQTYGPVDLIIQNSSGVPIKTVTTNSTDSGIDDTSNVPAGTNVLMGTHTDSIEPGNYIVCIDGHTDLCANFTKVVNQTADVTITVPESKSASLLNKSDASTCAIDGIGWIVCPVMNFIGGVTDAAYGVVASMLTTPASMFDTSQPTGKATLDAWTIMRNIANIAFVIAFLIIIYSQITGFGVSNYGVKKMLPRLIIAAILVNLSFFICALAVDATNIIGSSLKDLIDSVSKQIGAETYNSDWSGANSNSFTAAFGGVIAITALTGAALYAGLAVLLPILIGALVAVVTVVVVLTLRQALIILLVVISPLAFVAFLLPNTEEWFTKWRKLLATLLLMFPIIALVFGASALAGKIVMMSANGNVLVQIMGAGITIIPLFITPLVMKTAGGLLGKVGGFVNNPNKGPFDRMRKGAQRIREDQEGKRGIRAMNGGRVFGRDKFQRQAKREAVSQGIKSEAGRAKSQYIAEEIDGNDGFKNRVAGGSRGIYTPDATADAMQRALAGAKLTIDKAVAEDIQAESVIVRNMDSSALKGLLSSDTSSQAQKAAAMQRLIKISDPGDSFDNTGKRIKGYADDVDAAMKGSEILRRATAEALGKDGPGFIKASDIDKIATGTHKDRTGATSTLASIAEENVKTGVYSEEKMVDETKGNLQFAFDSADVPGKQKMVNTAAALKVNDNLKGKIKHNASAIDDLSRATRPS